MKDDTEYLLGLMDETKRQSCLLRFVSHFVKKI